MKKEIIYAAILAGMFLLVVLLPSIIFFAMGIPIIMASVGFGLGIVLLYKGKVAKRIWGDNERHSSSPTAASIVLCMTALIAAMKIFAFAMEYSAYRDMGYEFRPVSPQQYLPLLGASLLWAVLIFLVVLIRAAFKRKQV